MEKYISIQIDKIRPDKNQPRKSFDENALKGMAVSIENEGVINAIEVDEKFIIITGEQRWRAAKIAGLKEVPVKIIENITEKERFIRQMQENIHQNTMSALDTANAFEKVREWITKPAAGLVRDEKHQGSRYQKGTKELAKLFGISEETIRQYRNLLGYEGETKKALSDPNFSRTKLDELKKTPERYQKEFEHVIATQKKLPRDTVRNMATALRRAERYDEDDEAKDLLKQNFEELSTVEALAKINKIVPDDASRFKEPADAAKTISEKIIELMELLSSHPLNSLNGFSKPAVMKDLNNLGYFITSYFKGTENGEVKQITDKKLLLK
jgi:ParB-like partition proteins